MKVNLGGRIMKKSLLISLMIFSFSIFLIACSDSETNLEPTETDSYYTGTDTYTPTNDEPSTYEDTDSPYTKEELESDPIAPSTNPNDYNSDGEYVPQGGPSDNPEHYNADGEYKPVEDMTQEEIQAELESMLENSLGQ